MARNINDITKEMIADKFIEWVEADRAHQRAREALWLDDFCHIEVEFEHEREAEFRAPNKPYLTEAESVELVRVMYETLKNQNKVYNELIELTDLYLAKERG